MRFKMEALVCFFCCRYHHQYLYVSTNDSITEVTIKSLLEKTEELGLTDFVKAVKTLKLTKEFENGNFTLFVPENGAFSLDSDLIDAGTGIILKVSSSCGVCSQYSISTITVLPCHRNKLYLTYLIYPYSPS